MLHKFFKTYREFQNPILRGISAIPQMFVWLQYLYYWWSGIKKYKEWSSFLWYDTAIFFHKNLSVGSEIILRGDVDMMMMP